MSGGAYGIAVPRMDFSGLTNLGKNLSEQVDGIAKAKLTADLGEKIQSGDFSGAAQVALAGGELQTGLALAKMGETRGASQKLESVLGGLGFGGGAPAAPAGGGFIGSLTDGYKAEPGAQQAPAGPSFAATGGAEGDYLAQTRARESAGNDAAKNPLSSATGRYQFTDGTWQQTAQRHPELGLTPGGRLDPDQQERAMQAFTADNAKALTARGLPINPATLYASHVLGEAGGPKLIAGAMANPDQPAIGLASPGAVRSNRSIFFEKDGRPKTAGAVLAWFGGPQMSGGSATTQVASADAANLPTPDAQPAEYVIPPAQSGGRIMTLPSDDGPPSLGVPAPHNTTTPGAGGTGVAGAGVDGTEAAAGAPAPAAAAKPLLNMPPSIALAQAGVPMQASVAVGRAAPGSPERVGALIRASLIPGLSEQQQGVVKTLLATELEGSKAPDAVKQYLFAKSAAGGGFEGSFADFQNKKGDEGAKIQAQLAAREKWLTDHGMDPKDAGNQAWIMGGKTSTGHVLKPGDVLAGPSGQTLARNEGAAGSGMDDKTADFLAERVLAGDTKALIGLGRGAQGAENLGKIQGLVAQKAAARGLDGTDILYNAAKAAGLGAQERSLGTSAGRMAAASVEAEGAIKLGLEASAAVPRGSFVPLNRAIQLVQSNTGDPALKQFVAANTTIVNTFARAISPSGTPTVSDKEHAREMLSTADSPEAYAAVLQQMQKEIGMAHKAPQQARTILEQERQNAKGGGAGVADAGAAAGAKSEPAGTGSQIPKFNPSTSPRITMRDAQDLKAAEDTTENRATFDQRYGEGAAQFVLKKPAPAAPSSSAPTGARDPNAAARPQVVKGGKPPEGYSWDAFLAKGRETLKSRPDLRPQIEDMLAKAGIPPERLSQ